MKKNLFTAIFLIPAICLSAQSIDKAKSLFKEKNLAEAKTEIDKVLGQEQFQKNGEAWYTKAKIYNAVSFDPALKKKYPAARMDAFDALRKYTTVDDKMLLSLQIDGYKPINEIYTGYYQDAANSFNAKNYEMALADFTNAMAVSKFMTEKKWISLDLDTNSVLYAGVAAEKLGRPDDAVTYYSRLVEGNVKGEGFNEIYKWVANYHFEKKNFSEAARMIALGKSAYPDEVFWPSIELDMARETGDKDQLFAKYEEVIAGNASSHLYHYNYAVELYQVGYNTELSKRPANSTELIIKAKEQIRESVKLKPDYSRAQLFAGQIEYNNGVDQLRKNKEEALKYFEAAIPYFQQVEKILSPRDKLKAEDKGDLKEALDLLITIYDQMKMQDKRKEYEVKFNDVDKNH